MKFKFSSIRRVNYLHTLLFNFRTFPFHVARHLPVLIGYKVKISAPSRKCFSLSEDFDLHGAPIELGVRTNFSKGIPTQIRLIKKSSRLVLSNAVRVSKGSTILLHHGTLHMGKNSYCGERVLIVCHNRIDIGYNVAIAWNSQVYDSNFHFVYREKSSEIQNCTKPIKIGHNVWIGNTCTIAPGTVIPDYTTVAQNSLVNKNFASVPKGSLLAGIPAVLKKTEPFFCLLWNKNMERSLHRYFDENGQPEVFQLPENTPANPYDLES